jgi:hypothetical protein
MVFNLEFKGLNEKTASNTDVAVCYTVQLHDKIFSKYISCSSLA